VRKSFVTIIVYALVLAAALVGGAFYLNRPQLVIVDAELPAGFPENGFAHTAFESLLHQYVDSDGNIDYERWHGNASDLATLDNYLFAVSKFSPDNSPGRFSRRSDALAYWLYGYNAYVIRSVLDHWPLDSVTDVKAPIEAVKGLGFFYRQRFLFGENPLSLYAVEHEKILATFKDPRVHFVLNCASDSCPVLRPDLPTGDELERLLAGSTSDFVNDSRNVRVDHGKKQIVLSTIFKWYRNDFVNDLRRRGLSTERGVINYIVDAGSPALREELIVSADYEITFEDYDWSLNVAGAPAH
jgi:hypothetical protein